MSNVCLLKSYTQSCLISYVGVNLQLLSSTYSYHLIPNPKVANKSEASIAWTFLRSLILDFSPMFLSSSPQVRLSRGEELNEVQISLYLNTSPTSSPSRRSKDCSSLGRWLDGSALCCHFAFVRLSSEQWTVNSSETQDYLERVVQLGR